MLAKSRGALTMVSYASRWLYCLGLLTFAAATHAGDPTLFYLDLSGQVLRADANGVSTVVVNGTGGGPDGIAIDDANKHIYWTNMGKVSADDGFILRADLNGDNVTTIVSAGGTFTPKQLKIDTKNKKLYWSDREGMRVMRANLDGSQIETLVVTGTSDEHRKDQSRWCVGLALDVERGKVYWSQKGADNAHQGTIKRANLEIPAGQTAANRTDIEVLFSGLPEPIDLELNLKRQQLYWTDRGDNTISRAPLYPKAKFDPSKRTDREILVRDLHEVIGIALDEQSEQMFYTSLTGELGVATLNGDKARLLRPNTGRLTGIAVTHLSVSSN
jgi:sugar lactone lactonase YvrE